MSYDHRSPLRVGVLLVNLGTPDAPTTKAVHRYLNEFLSDPRVVGIPQVLWLPLLRGVILPLRSPKSAKAYASIWSDQGSPLLVNSRNIAQQLQQTLAQQHPDISVDLAMNYGNPSLASCLQSMHERNIKRILVLPLFPQYSASTAGATFDLIAQFMKAQHWLPDLRFISSYHDDAGYIDACVQQIADHRATHGAADRLVLSFHGLPKRNLLLGDPYHCQCHKTARLIAEKLGLSDKQWMITFQSRFGKAEWLQPYTDKTLIDIAQNSNDSVDVFCPGFSADCLETLEEIAMQNRDFYMDNGGKHFTYIPALNDNAAHIESLAKILNTHLSGWEDWQDDAINGEAVRAVRADRAAKLEQSF